MGGGSGAGLGGGGGGGVQFWLPNKVFTAGELCAAPIRVSRGSMAGISGAGLVFPAGDLVLCVGAVMLAFVLILSGLAARLVGSAMPDEGDLSANKASHAVTHKANAMSS